MGLLNEGMRFRDLETGVFLTRDPIGYGDGPNIYCYVHCNPITKFDALGLAMQKANRDYTLHRETAEIMAGFLYFADGSPNQRLNGLTKPSLKGHYGVLVFGRTTSISGRLHIDMHIDKTRPDFAGIEKHEQKHVGDLVQNWNKLVDSVNRFDGRDIKLGHSAEEVSGKVSDYLQNELDHFAKYSDKEGKLFDKNEARKDKVGKGQSKENYDKKIDKLEKEYQEKLSDLQEDKQGDREKLDEEADELEEYFDPQDDGGNKWRG